LNHHIKFDAFESKKLLRKMSAAHTGVSQLQKKDAFHAASTDLILEDRYGQIFSLAHELNQVTYGMLDRCSVARFIDSLKVMKAENALGAKNETALSYNSAFMYLVTLGHFVDFFVKGHLSAKAV
jgi:hypothetical protein